MTVSCAVSGLYVSDSALEYWMDGKHQQFTLILNKINCSSDEAAMMKHLIIVSPEVMRLEVLICVIKNYGLQRSSGFVTIKLTSLICTGLSQRLDVSHLCKHLFIIL
jgi:hypothetical protein